MRGKYIYYHNTGNQTSVARALFITYLRNSFNQSDIRAVVVRLHIGNASISKTSGIECICNYLNDQPNLTNLSSEPEEQETLSWSIDRTPAIIPTPSYTLVSNPVQTRVSLHDLQGDPEVEQILHDAGITFEDMIAFGQFINHIHTRERHISIPKNIKMKLVSYNYENKLFDCPICLDNVYTNSSVKLNCSHVFCSTCIEQTIKTCENNMICALCREHVSAFQVYSDEVYENMKKNNRIEVV